MNEIGIKNSILVKVNEQGDTIVINVEDQQFIDKFYGLIYRLEEIQKEVSTKEVMSLDEREQLRVMINKTKEIMSDIDSMFGKDACLKVFGDIIPSPYLIADFFEQLTPIAEQYMNERQKKIADKYSRNRKNQRGNKYRTKEEIIKDNMR